MSIFSKAKAAVKKVVNTLTGKSNTASAMASWPQAASSLAVAKAVSSSSANAAANKNKQMGVQTGVQGYQVQSSPLGQIAVNTKDGSFQSYNPTTGPSGPQYFNTTPQAEAARVAALNQPRTVTGGSTTGGTVLSGNSPTVNNATKFNISGTQTSESLGARSLNGGASGSGVSSVGGGGSMPTTGAVSNPGVVTTAGSAYTGLKAYNPETGLLEDVPQEKIDEEKEKESAYEKFAAKYFPQKDSVFNDPAVKAERDRVNQKQIQVDSLTAQLNDIVVKQQQHLSRIREIGSNEGVTETVFGQQESNINRNYAMQALPIQAQIAAAQGDLERAQGYLKQVTDMRTEDINNDYTYRKGLFDFAKEYGDREEKALADKMSKESDRDWQMKLATMNDVHSFASSLLDSNPALASKLFNLDPKSATYQADASRLLNQAGVTLPASPGSTAPVGLSSKKSEDFNADLVALAKSTSREEALSTLNQIQTSAINTYGQANFEKMKAEVDRVFPPPVVATISSSQGGSGAVYNVGKRFGEDIAPLVQGPAGLVNSVTSGIGNFFSGLFSN